MDSILAIEEDVAPEDLEKYRRLFEKEQESGGGNASVETQFAYAWCLVRSRATNNLRLGTQLLEDLFRRTSDETAKRDYLYFTAVGYCRLKEYERALRFTKAIMMAEPGNRQAEQLDTYIKKKMKTDGLIGMAVIGGAAAVALGSIIGLGVALSKK
jgi:fission 1 protein